MIKPEEWADLMAAQETILKQLKELNNKGPSDVPVRYISAIKFMKAVDIKRTKFDELVHTNKIKTIKKRRKIYVPITEIDRYFLDPSIR